MNSFLRPEAVTHQNAILVTSLATILATIFVFPMWPFTLEDTWIFLALGKTDFGPEALYGATSIAWGVISSLLTELFSGDTQTLAIKIVGFAFWVFSFVVVISVILKIDKPPLKIVLLLGVIFGMMPTSIWAFSGMDAALSMAWSATIIAFIVLGVDSGRNGNLVVLFSVAAIVYLIRPEMAWAPFFLLLVFWKELEPRRLTFYLVLCVLLTVVSIFLYYILTGSIRPSSSVKVVGPTLSSSISTAWLVLQMAPILIVGLLGLLERNRIKLNIIALTFIILRLGEHWVLGGIDHRTLAVLAPWLIFIIGINCKFLPWKSTVIFILWFSVLYILNVANAQWYSKRTVAVHQEVVKELEALPESKRIGTDEIGLLGWELGLDRIADYHGLIKNKLLSPSEVDVLVFTGDLYRHQALEYGFSIHRKICFEHWPTIYVRSIGFSNKQYCKTIYKKPVDF